MSVVVPPTSTVHTSRRPARCHAPTALAAGPERIVSTGRPNAHSARTSEPSPFTTISGATSPRSTSVACTEVISSVSGAIKCAFRVTVVARRTALNWLVSSWPQVAGSPLSSSTNAFTRSSWAGLRTLK